MVTENIEPFRVDKKNNSVKNNHYNHISLKTSFLVHLGAVATIVLISAILFDPGRKMVSQLSTVQIQLLSLLLVCIVITVVFIILKYRQLKFNRKISELNKTIEVFEERLTAENALRLSEEKFRTLNQLISEMILLRDMDSIYKFITDSLHKRYPETIILYNSIDEENGLVRFESLAGININILNSIIKITGFNPLGQNYRLTPVHEGFFRQGKLVKFIGSLEEFSKGELPDNASKVIDRLIGLNNIYTIGINKDDRIFAAIHFFSLNNSSITDNEFVEAFVSHAAIIIQKRLAEIALMESEERLMTIVEGSLDAIIAVDVNGKIAVYNGQAQSLFQYTEAEALNKPVSILLREEIGEIHQEWLDRYMNKGVGHCGHIGKREEKLFRRKDGSLFTAEISMSGSRKDDLCLIVLSIHDITERKDAENALKDSEQRFAMFMDHLPAIAFITDSNQRLIYINKAMDEAVGASKWIGKTCSEVLDKERSSKICMDDSISMQSGPIITEDCMLNLDGKIHYYETHKFIMKRHDGGDLMGAIAIDVTDRKIVENKLKDSEYTARTLINSSERLSILVDVSDNTIIDLNEYGALCIGKSISELIGADAFSYMPDDSTGTRLKKIREVIVSGKPANFQDERDGMYFENHIYPVVDNKGAIKRLAIFAHEITEIKIVEERLKKLNLELINSNSMKDKLISIIAHDLRSPFSSILGFSELLGENFRYYDIKKTEKIIEIINTSAKHTLALLDNLLIWARMQQGKLDFKPEMVVMIPLINEVTDMLSSSARFKSIKIINSMPEGLSVYADVNMLKTIMRNIIQNSIKFSNPCSQIEISSEMKEDHVMIAVRDEGIGMDKETLGNLFHVGASVSTMGTANESGSGWGLILCKEFIEKHGGTIDIESSPGEGSKFRFFLPFSGKN